MRTAFTIAAVLLCVPQDPPAAPRAEDVDQWVARLGHADISVRESARAAILGLQADLIYARESLDKARESKDPQVALQAAQLRAALDDGFHEKLRPAPDVSVEEVQARAAKLGEYKRMVDEAGKLAGALSQGGPARERTYQSFLVRYKGLRELFTKGDPVYVNQLDEHKRTAEAAYGGSARLVQEAKRSLSDIEVFASAGDVQGVEGRLQMLRQMRSRREFYQDERVLELVRVIEAAERKLAAMRKR